MDPPVNVKAASNGEFNVRESAAKETCTGTLNKPTAETTGRQRLDGLSKRLSFGKLHDVVKCMTEWESKMGEERPQVDTDTMVCNDVEHATISKSIGVEHMFW